MKVWQKGGAKLDKRVEAFTVGRDAELDRRLVQMDCLAGIAHAKMLSKAGILGAGEAKKLQEALLRIISLGRKGKFVISVADEDVHSKVENTLTAQLGDLGKKLHTGRSRNDQVLTDLRLYSKEQLLAVEGAVLELCDALLALAKKNEFVPMPGYTHMQRAMPSSVGLWAGAFAEALLDDLQLLKAAFALNDQSPLGSAAGYGAGIKLDRALTAKLLGFKKVQNNNLYVQNSRGKVEAAVLFALLEVMLSLNKLAADLMLFSTKEFGFVSLPQEFCTGSSIMPQKSNPDVLELVRGKSSAMLSHLGQTIGIIGNLPSGYNRDLQLTKAPLLDGFKSALETIAITALVVPKIKFNKEAMAAACSPEIFAADSALLSVKQGVPFRDAYRTAAKNCFVKEKDVAANLKGKRNIGGTGNLGLARLLDAVKKEKSLLKKEKTAFFGALKRLGKD